nr:MAG TPA: hypothetical protein [Caudoviricetes sp.]
MKKLLLCILPFIVFAQAKEYTPSQLKQMINYGDYPQQGEAKSESSRMDFSDCVLKTKVLFSQIAGNYLVSTIVNTSMVYSVKAWVNDAALVVTCSQPDGKRVITQSPYK